jgi:hypothetical protein
MDRLIDSDDTAAKLGVSRETFNKLRTYRGGPAFKHDPKKWQRVFQEGHARIEAAAVG